MSDLARRLLTTFLALSCLMASLLSYRSELEAREPVEKAISASLLDSRRPDEVRTLRYQPAADIRASFFAIMTLDDLYRPVSLAKLSGDERGRWLQSLVTLDSQLVSARDLELDALSRRPGWAYHHALIGQLEYGRLRRGSIRGLVDDRVRWDVPLRNGISSAPGDTWLPTYLALGYVSIWGEIPQVADFSDIVARAMRRDEFVRQYYRILTVLLGDEATIALLPDNPGTLRVALARDRKDGHVEAVDALLSRIDLAVREGRVRDLESIRERRKLRDAWGQRVAASQWVSRYRPEYLDDEAGRGEVAEVLSLWPATRRGTWLNDPRAGLVRYFLSGRERSIDGVVVDETVSLLSSVPDPVRARALSLAGRTWEADQMVRAANTAGSFEWTPAILDLARAYLEAGKRDAAASALERLAPAARDECNALILRRDLDPSDGPAAEALADLSGHLLLAGRGEVIPLCIDPAVHSSAQVVVTISSSDASVVSYGWDGGRLGSVLVPGETSLKLPLSGMIGRHPFRIVTEVGPKAIITNAVIEHSGRPGA